MFCLPKNHNWLSNEEKSKCQTKGLSADHSFNLPLRSYTNTHPCSTLIFFRPWFLLYSSFFFLCNFGLAEAPYGCGIISLCWKPIDVIVALFSTLWSGCCLHDTFPFWILFLCVCIIHKECTCCVDKHFSLFYCLLWKWYAFLWESSLPSVHVSGKARSRLFISRTCKACYYLFISLGELVTVCSFLLESWLPSVHFSGKARYRLTWDFIQKLICVLSIKYRKSI